VTVLAALQRGRRPSRPPPPPQFAAPLSAAPGRARRARPVAAQANLFARAVRVFKSYANAIGERGGEGGERDQGRRGRATTAAHTTPHSPHLSLSVSAAEDPEKMLEQTVNEMQGDLIKMRQASAQVLASQKQLEAKYKAAQTTADEWYRRAELALQKGDDDLAREALKRRKAYDEQASSMAGQLAAQKKAADTLIANTRALEGKLVEAKSKKDTLKARAKSAAASKAVNDMVQGLNASNAGVAFDRMEEKVLALEGEADAAAQLTAPDDVEKAFGALEGSSLDDDLARMKAGLALGSGRVKAALPEGRPLADAFDAELEELRRKARE